MPNTLAHLGLQGATCRLLIPRADIKWVWLGCVVPDAAWILQRLASMVFPGIDPYGLRLYAVVQASLGFSLLLAVALAMVSRRPAVTAAIVGGNALLHMLLDACQIKWANGVHLLGPVSWHNFQWGFFWPEQWPTIALTLWGGVWCVHQWLHPKSAKEDAVGPPIPPARRWTAIALLGAFLMLPAALTGGALRSNAHYVQTLTAGDHRVGRPVAFDRNQLRVENQKPQLRTFAGEILELTGSDLPAVSGPISLKGVFTGRDRIRVLAWHRHWRGWRDGFSIVGLIMVGGVWLQWWRRRKTTSVDRHDTGCRLRR